MPSSPFSRSSRPSSTTTSLTDRTAGRPRPVDAVIIGAGQAGLAMSRHLTDRQVDHVVLERGDIANAWRTERWDSLRLLTPNWQTRLPGWRYRGDDPDGYMTMPEVADYLTGFARSFDAPVHAGVTVTAVRPQSGRRPGYEVVTDQGWWRARSVVVAAGACGTPAIPSIADRLDAGIRQLTPIDYRNPEQLPPGGVLVVGASASGVQLADELARAGRAVTVAVGRHVRLPRTYRGRDIQWWLDGSGLLDTHYTDVDDIDAARRAPSLQIVGTPDRRTLDLDALTAEGVRLVGRLERIDGSEATFADDLQATCADADRRLTRILDRLDEWAVETGAHDLDPVERPAPIEPPQPARHLDLTTDGIGTVIWATGFRPHYPWLHVPVTDATGAIDHDGGITPAPGLYVTGLPFLRRRKSTFIDGAGADAADLADHLTTYLTTYLTDHDKEPTPMTPNPAPTPIPTAPAEPRHDRYDVVIVGARTAGAATAMLLARRGLRVLAVDRTALGSDTLSTHALMRGAVNQLGRWGLLDRVVATGTPAVTTTTFRYDDTELDVDLGGGRALFAPRRTVLDRLLVEAARESGAEVCHGVAVDGLITDGAGRVGGVELRIGDGGRPRSVRADLVVGADGLRSTVARLVEAPPTRVGTSASATIFRYVTGADLRTDRYHWLYRCTDDGERLAAGVIPTNDDAHCVFVSLPPDRFATKGRRDVTGTYATILETVAPDVAAGVRSGMFTGRPRTWPGHPGRFLQAHGPGWALVGDAGYFKDPAAAHGISDSLRDAELLADAVVADDLASYEATRDELATPLFEALEDLASWRWTMDELPTIHLAVGKAMSREHQAVAALLASRGADRTLAPAA